MIRLRHITTGAVVSVTDEKAARMGSEWVPAEESQATQKRRPAPKSK